jgi:processed acidic surface protein
VIALMEDPELDIDQFFMSMEEIGARLMDFPEFDSATDLSPEDIAEFIDIWNDMLELLQLDVEYFLTKDGQSTPLSFTALMQLESTNGADLMIKISSLEGELLADMVITKDMFGSEFIEETGENIEQTTEAAEEVAVAVEKMPEQKPVAKTVTGGKLPNTASNYLQNTLAGLAIILLGAFVFRKVTVKRA